MTNTQIGRIEAFIGAWGCVLTAYHLGEGVSANIMIALAILNIISYAFFAIRDNKERVENGE